MGGIPRTTLGWVVAAACASGSSGGRVRAQEPAFPDFDLRIECASRVMGAPGEVIRFPAATVLSTSPGQTDGRVGARAWSLSLLAGRGARIVAATTDGTPAAPIPDGLRDDGFEKTELAQGAGNEGVVSAVILSLSRDVYLPGSGEETLLYTTVESVVPAAGCVQAAIDFVDGLAGSGQPVKNIITWGEDFGFTRKDDGGGLDNDMDGYEPCTFFVCDGPYFVRGDADGDLDVTLSDGILLLEHLFAAGRLACPRAADMLEDGALDLSDGVYLLNHLFIGGPAPAAPYPDCGLPPRPDGGALECDAARRCG